MLTVDRRSVANIRKVPLYVKTLLRILSFLEGLKTC